MSIPTNMLFRLHNAIVAAGVAIAGVDINGNVQPSSLQAAAQSTIDAFDPSAAAQSAWRDQQQPDLSAARDAAQAALSVNTTYLNITSPSNAQVAAQAKALTQQNQQIIKAIKLLAIAAIG